jgi:Zn-dependent protease
MSRRTKVLSALLRPDALPYGCPPSSAPENPFLDIQGLLIFAPVLLFSVIAHEYAHGYAALRQGDNTALALGRLTWNPVKHIDPWMTIIVPAGLWILSKGTMLLGGAKPVPVNPRNYRNFMRGDIIVSLAGVATNLVIAFLCWVLFPLLGALGRSVPSLETAASILQAMMIQGMLLNLILVVFNLIPIPPLDGSHVMKYLLPASIALQYQRVSRYGIIVLIALMWVTPGVLSFIMTPAFRTFGWSYSAVEGAQLPQTQRWLR